MADITSIPEIMNCALAVDEKCGGWSNLRIVGGWMALKMTPHNTLPYSVSS